MKKYRLSLIGVFIIILGIGMFFFAASIFTYQGNSLNPIVSKLGMYSFILWLPTIIFGIALFLTGFALRK
jgi:hypothetical protein